MKHSKFSSGDVILYKKQLYKIISSGTKTTRIQEAHDILLDIHLWGFFQEFFSGDLLKEPPRFHMHKCRWEPEILDKMTLAAAYLQSLPLNEEQLVKILHELFFHKSFTAFRALVKECSPKHLLPLRLFSEACPLKDITRRQTLNQKDHSRIRLFFDARHPKVSVTPFKSVHPEARKRLYTFISLILTSSLDYASRLLDIPCTGEVVYDPSEPYTPPSNVYLFKEDYDGVFYGAYRKAGRIQIEEFMKTSDKDFPYVSVWEDLKIASNKEELQ